MDNKREVIFENDYWYIVEDKSNNDIRCYKIVRCEEDPDAIKRSSIYYVKNRNVGCKFNELPEKIQNVVLGGLI